MTRQLERVRRHGRMLLVGQRLAQWVTAVACLAMACGLVDYALRLPPWPRLVIAVAVATMALGWLVRRVAEAARFSPSLSVLALRAERMYPQLAGVLASGVEFATRRAPEREPPTTAAFIDATLRHAEGQASDLPFAKMLKPAPALHNAFVMALVLTVFGGLVWASPQSSLLAARRWFAPLSDARWPRRTHVSGVFGDGVWPIDQPLRLTARVDRGYRPGMRTWVIYRVMDAEQAAGPLHRLLMNEQAADSGASDHGKASGTFEQLIDLSDAASGSAPIAGGSVEFYFEAGDDRTELRRVRLVSRPEVRGVMVRTDPPNYAMRMLNPQQVALDQFRHAGGRVATTAALVGSQITLQIELNKPIPIDARQWATVLPGLVKVPADQLRLPPEPSGFYQMFEIIFPLRQTFQTPIHLTDEHGLTDLSERLYRIEAIEDRLPAVSLLEPATDESVLGSAVIHLDAVAQDDVGVEWLRIEAQVPVHDSPSFPASQTTRTVVLEAVSGAAARMTTGHRLDLTTFDLRSGDQVVLEAIGRDMYKLDGARHDPVRSSPRRLRIIDDATLVAQIRSELAGLRQQVVRLERQQRELVDAPVGQAQTDQGFLDAFKHVWDSQQQIDRSLDSQAALLDRLQRRAAINRLDDPTL
ncbi:MAG: hypothetical protein V3U29_08475, partial [Phycisphaeraceae bacterium]